MSRRCARRWLAALAAGAVAGALACGGPQPSVERPVAKPVTVSARRASFGGVVVRAQVEVTNPNPFEIELEAMDWELSVDGSAPAQQRSPIRKRIASRASSVVEVGMRIAPAAAVHITSRLAVGARAYRISGVLHFASARGRLAVQFESPGELE